ncbi:MAG: pyruvate dehydrogenase complex dihydrolipoyllysine-residue acetyltransferase [Ktedonobacteraceae bacterium]
MQFRLPDLGEGMTEAELVRWLVKPGDKVRLDQEVAEVQTDKAIVELPSPVEGIVLELNVAEGQVVPVKTVLFTISEEVESTAPSAIEAAKTNGQSETETRATSPSPFVSSARSTGSTAHVALPEMARENDVQPDHEANRKGGGRVLATPVARRMARVQGIDITTITGSGPAGRVRTEDVQKLIALREAPAKRNGGVSAPAAGNGKGSTLARSAEVETAERQPHAPAHIATGPTPSGEGEQDEERIPLRGLRRRIAENMVLSVSTIPQVTSMVEVDASGLVALRQSILAQAEAQGVKLSYLPFIIKALVHALRLYPYVNATIEHEEIVLKRTYHIGIATATPDGLLVPVLRFADRLTVLEIAQEVSRLAERGRERKLQVHELRGSSFTISNYGTVGGFFTTPIINPGEAGILGLGRIVKRPWVVDDRIEVRPVLPLSFTADHRLLDGEQVMRFLNTLVASLENPNLLLLHMR